MKSIKCWTVCSREVSSTSEAKAKKMGRSLALLLAVATVASAQTNQPCQNGWREFNGSCYYFGPMKLWTDARDDCTQSGAQMAIITDSATNEYVGNMGKLEGLSDPDTDRVIWLGLNDQSTKGDFRWTDGSKPTYTNWASGEPNDADGYEDCTQIYVDTKMWNDIACTDEPAHYVCQIKTNDDTFRCSDGQTIPQKWACDRIVDCANADDELNCGV